MVEENKSTDFLGIIYINYPLEKNTPKKTNFSLCFSFGWDTITCIFIITDDSGSLVILCTKLLSFAACRIYDAASYPQEIMVFLIIQKLKIHIIYMLITELDLCI